MLNTDQLMHTKLKGMHFLYDCDDLRLMLPSLMELEFVSQGLSVD